MKRIAVLEPEDGNRKHEPDPTREQLLALVNSCLKLKDVKGRERKQLVALKLSMESEELAEGVTEFFEGFFEEPGTIQLISMALGRYVSTHQPPKPKTKKRSKKQGGRNKQ